MGYYICIYSRLCLTYSIFCRFPNKIKLISIATIIILTRRPESPTDEPNTTLSRALSPARAPASHSQGTRQDWRHIPMSSVLRRHMQSPTETPVAADIQFVSGPSGPSGTPFRDSRLFNLLQLLSETVHFALHSGYMSMMVAPSG